MNPLTLVLCPDADEWHGGMYPTYLYFPSGLYLTQPTKKHVDNALKHFKKMEVRYEHCAWCFKRGVRGISHFSNEELNQKLLRGI